MPLISICIPAYNRANLLPELLDSIINQDFSDYEIIISEDFSPERNAIRSIVLDYKKNLEIKINYLENIFTLGYDGNLRKLIENSTGDYILFLGNDDLLCDGALKAISEAIKENNKVGVILRSYASFIDNIEKPIQMFHYFNEDRIFQPGTSTIITFFRRSVFISGLVIKRKSALNYSTNIFDGTLLYQLYLVSCILNNEYGIYLHKIISYHRLGGVPDFGNSDSEKDIHTPKIQTPESSINFISGMLKIAKYIENKYDVKVYKKILNDIGNYSYPIISIQSNQPFKVFIYYILKLLTLGLWRSPLFFVYSILLIIFRKYNCDFIILKIKKLLGRSPIIGNVYAGEYRKKNK